MSNLESAGRLDKWPSYFAVIAPVIPTLGLAGGCGSGHAVIKLPDTEVVVARPVQQDVPIESEWVATLEQPHLPEVPAGIPSRLLERRSDIREVEARLMAANAQIGVAKADYFPQITLTANSGFQSSALTSLFSGPAGFWTFGGSLAQPIFAGGRIKSGVRLSQARQKELELTYQQTIQQAFRGVSDSLIGYQKNCEYRERQEDLVRAAQDHAGSRWTHCRIDNRFRWAGPSDGRARLCGFRAQLSWQRQPG
jgi:Outer membrane efflux protein